LKKIKSILFGLLPMFILTGCGSIGNESQIEEQEKKKRIILNQFLKKIVQIVL